MNKSSENALASQHQIVPPDEKQPSSELSTPSNVPNQGPVAEAHGLKWAFAYAALASTVLFYSLDTTIVADIQPQIVESLGDVGKLPWIGVGINLGCITILPLGKAFGVFNVKYLFIACVIGFEIGSAICGAAPNMNAMIVGRVLQGAAGSGMYSGALNYIALTTTMQKRPIYLSGLISVWGIGCILGPVIGGGFAQSHATWRWAFYINLVVAAVTAPAILFCLPNINPLDLPLRDKLRTQDWIGITVLLGGGTCYTMAIAFGGTTYAFSSGSEIALWVMTGVSLIAFILVTAYHPGVTSQQRLYPFHLMKQWEMNILQYHLFMVAGAMFLTLYYTPLIFQFTRSDGPLMAGVRLLPFISMIVFFSFLNGGLMPVLGYYMPWYVAGDILILVGSALMGFTVDASTPVSNIYGYTALIGMGIGCFMLAGMTVVQAKLPTSEISNAVAFMTIGQMFGAITLLSVAGALFQNLGAQYIQRVLPSASVAQADNLITGRTSPVFQSLTSDQQDDVVQQVTLAIQNIFVLQFAAVCLALIGAVFLKREKLKF